MCVSLPQRPLSRVLCRRLPELPTFWLLCVSAAASGFSCQFSFVLALSGLRDCLQGMLGARETKRPQLSFSFGLPPLQPSRALRHSLAGGCSRSCRDPAKGGGDHLLGPNSPLWWDGQRGSDVCVEEVRDAGPEGCPGLTGGVGWQPPPCAVAHPIASPGSSVQCFHSVFSPFSPQNRKTFAVKILKQNLSFSSGFRAAALEAALAASASGSGCLVLPPRPLRGRAGLRWRR